MRALTLSWGLFMLYCLEVGLLLSLLPWGAGWDRYAVQLAHTDLRQLALSPWTRAACSSFGILHLSLAIHDLQLVLTGVLRRARR